MDITTFKRKGQRLLSNSLSRNQIKECSRMLLIKNDQEEVMRLWELGKKLRVIFSCEDEDIVKRIMEVERRDKRELQKMEGGRGGEGKSMGEIMIIFSHDVRGLVGNIKKRGIKGVVSKERAKLVCLQEIKMEEVMEATCRAIVSNFEVEWRILPTINTVRGVLCVWKKRALEVEEVCMGHGFWV